jgi:hypothetical protein
MKELLNVKVRVKEVLRWFSTKELAMFFILRILKMVEYTQSFQVVWVTAL